MGKYGLLIDYNYCCACHTCEVACKMEHGIPEGEWGIKLVQVGPWKIGETRKWQDDNFPVPTSQCNLCAERTAKGKLPACVHSCYTQAMHYGRLEDLVKEMAEKPKTVLFSPR